MKRFSQMITYCILGYAMVGCGYVKEDLFVFPSENSTFWCELHYRRKIIEIKPIDSRAAVDLYRKFERKTRIPTNAGTHIEDAPDCFLSFKSPSGPPGGPVKYSIRFYVRNIVTVSTNDGGKIKLSNEEAKYVKEILDGYVRSYDESNRPASGEIDTESKRKMSGQEGVKQENLSDP